MDGEEYPIRVSVDKPSSNYRDLLAKAKLELAFQRVSEAKATLAMDLAVTVHNLPARDRFGLPHGRAKKVLGVL